MNSRKAITEVGAYLSLGLCNFHIAGKKVHAWELQGKGNIEFHIDERTVREENPMK